MLNKSRSAILSGKYPSELKPLSYNQTLCRPEDMKRHIDKQFVSYTNAHNILSENLCIQNLSLTYKQIHVSRGFLACFPQ